MENYIVINGKKAELTEEQLEKLGIEVKNDPFKKEEGHKYFCIENDGTISCFTDCNDPSDIAFYDIANYCKDKKAYETTNTTRNLKPPFVEIFNAE